MRAVLAASLGVVLASCATAPSPDTNAEAELAKIIDGRVASPPVDCINQREIKTSRIINGLAIVYTMTNGTLYVNRPSGAASLRRDDVLVTETHSSQLCSIDIVRLSDRTTQIQSGSVGLGKFVPYLREDRRGN